MAIAEVSSKTETQIVQQVFNSLPITIRKGFKTIIYNTMARQKSYVRIRGSLGGLTFYKKNGEDVIRTTGGATKEQIAKDPRFRRTRENMKEFAGAAKAGKALRECFKNVAKRMSDDTAVGRVTGIMRHISSSETGVRGQRPMLILPKKAFIEGFEFNRHQPLSSIFYAAYGLPTLDANRNLATWEVPDFSTVNDMGYPEGATHFKLVLAVGVLSDYVYSTATKVYEPINPDEDQTKGVAYTAEIPIGGMVGSATTLTVDLGFAAALPATVGVLVGIGIIFYQEVDGVYYELASDNALKLAVVG